jgi:tetratricopeptide (TPR) repeat protein
LHSSPAILLSYPGIKSLTVLLLLLKYSKQDTNRVLLLYELGSHSNLSIKNKESLKYATEALDLSKKINYKRGECLAYYILGINSHLLNNYTESLEYGKKILKVSQPAGFQQGIAMGYLLIGWNYYDLKDYNEAFRSCIEAKRNFELAGDKINFARAVNMLAAIYRIQDNYREAIKNYIIAAFAWKESGYKNPEAALYERIAEMFSQLGGNDHQAIDYYNKALNIWQSMGNKNYVAWSYHYIGKVFMKLNEDSLAIQNLSISLKINEETGDTIGIAENINTIGEFFIKQTNYSGALYQFYRSLKLYKQVNEDEGGIPRCYFNIGYVFKMQGDSALSRTDIKTADDKYKKAHENYLISLNGYRELSKRAFVADVSVNIGEVQTKLRNYSDAENFLLSGLQSALEFGEKETIAKSYLFLSQLDSVKGNYGKAYQHFKLYMLYRDSLFNAGNLKKVEAAKLQSEFESKEQEIKLLSAENKLKTTVAEKQSQQKKFAYAAIALVLVFSVYAFYRYRLHKKTELEQSRLKDRLHISRGLHDDMGSTLSSISVYSMVAQQKNYENSKEELNDVLGKNKYGFQRNGC